MPCPHATTTGGTVTAALRPPVDVGGQVSVTELDGQTVLGDLVQRGDRRDSSKVVRLKVEAGNGRIAHGWRLVDEGAQHDKVSVMSADQAARAFRTRKPRSGARDDDPLAEFHVSWLQVSVGHVDEYQTVLESATAERPLQKHLTRYPMLLTQILDGGHGRWVLPHKSLAGRFEADFILGHRWSGPTWEWILVELQTPKLASKRNAAGRLFLKSGRTSEQLDEGLRQINEWRRWIAANIDMAKRPRGEMGLGLSGIESSPPGILLIGREADLTPEHASMRKQLGDQHNVKIRSYDWLLREARARLTKPGRIDGGGQRLSADQLFIDPDS